MEQLICKQCECIGKPKKVTKGSIFIELILWLCLLLPGFIYSIWRLTTKHKACSSCGSVDIIGLDTPAGRRLVGDKR